MLNRYQIRKFRGEIWFSDGAKGGAEIWLMEGNRIAIHLAPAPGEPWEEAYMVRTKSEDGGLTYQGSSTDGPKSHANFSRFPSMDRRNRGQSFAGVWTEDGIEHFFGFKIPPTPFEAVPEAIS